MNLGIIRRFDPSGNKDPPAFHSYECFSFIITLSELSQTKLKNNLAFVTALMHIPHVLSLIQMQASVVAILNVTTIEHSTAIPEVKLA